MGEYACYEVNGTWVSESPTLTAGGYGSDYSHHGDSGEDAKGGPLSAKFWELLLPAIPVGLSLYLSKKRHWSPLVVLGFIVFPLALFYAVLFGSGASMPVGAKSVVLSTI